MPDKFYNAGSCSNFLRHSWPNINVGYDVADADNVFNFVDKILRISEEICLDRFLVFFLFFSDSKMNYFWRQIFLSTWRFANLTFSQLLRKKISSTQR
jgi:hypothetical protein